MSAILASINQDLSVFKVLLAVSTLSAIMMAPVHANKDILTITVHARNVLLVLSGALLLINASLSVDKTQLILKLPKLALVLLDLG